MGRSELDMGVVGREYDLTNCDLGVKVDETSLSSGGRFLDFLDGFVTPLETGMWLCKVVGRPFASNSTSGVRLASFSLCSFLAFSSLILLVTSVSSPFMRSKFINVLGSDTGSGVGLLRTSCTLLAKLSKDSGTGELATDS